MSKTIKKAKKPQTRGYKKANTTHNTAVDIRSVSISNTAPNFDARPQSILSEMGGTSVGMDKKNEEIPCPKARATVPSTASKPDSNNTNKKRIH